MEDLKRWLPTTRKEMEIRGWDSLDVILFSGDAYIDHPSFGAAVIGRVLEAEGLRVGIVPQPNWRDDLRDFKKLGTPSLFFGVSAGAMDSMVNRFTANKRLRSNDAYTPDGRADMRPEYPTIVYSSILKKLFPDVPVVIGGIEASLRRLTHYDYWQDQLRPSILIDSQADILVYGMGEKTIVDLARVLQQGIPTEEKLRSVSQIAYLSSTPSAVNDCVVLHSHEECVKDKRKQAENFRIFEEESNRRIGARLLQRTGSKTVVVNPPNPPMNTEQIDASFDLPYTRLPHPKYRGKAIPAYEMIKFSVNIHRGCFGGCSFCTISAHQGKQVVSRSEQSIIKEVEALTRMADFKGYLSDLGGPSANMYRMEGANQELCDKCKKPSCLFPRICPNLNVDHSPLLRLMHKVSAIQGVKKVCIGSGLRYDLMLHRSKNSKQNHAAQQYTREVIANHVSGRLKVAPEHTSDRVLATMRKPSFELFRQFNQQFDEINRQEGLKQQLIPYFISSHPSCTKSDMKELSQIVKRLNFKLEQIQDFTPTPMTLATEMYYTGLNPYTLEPVFCARTREEKLAQRDYFFK